MYSEKVSAAETRLELHQALKSLRSGDVLVVWRRDRLARSRPLKFT
ncbi:recombinase family protein [Undibacterium sp. GrIS 1.8]